MSEPFLFYGDWGNTHSRRLMTRMLTNTEILYQYFCCLFLLQVDTAGWLERTKEKGPASLSIMQTRKNLMRAHVVALVLDGEEVSDI